MNGWPEDVDVDEFVGRQVEAVTFTENTISIGFSDELRVTLYGVVCYRPGEGTGPQTERPPVAATGLVAAVGRTVQRAELRTPKEVVLFLGDGFTITLLDEQDMYESYLIALGDREIPV